MKNARVMAGLAAAGMTLAGLGGAAFGQVDRVQNSRESGWGPGQWMAQAMADVIDMARVAAERSNYGLDRDRVSLLGGFFDEGSSGTMIWTFDRGERVLFIGGGDEDANDIDLRLVRVSDGYEVAKDVSVRRSAMLEVVIPSDGRYRLEMDLYDADAPSFCSVALLVRGDRPTPMSHLTRSTGQFLAAGRHFSENGLPTQFEKNEWSLFGTSLAGGESVEISGLDIPGGDDTIVAVSHDTEAFDLDMRLMNKDRATLDSDTLADGIPIVSTPYGVNDAIVAVWRADSGRDEAFCVFGILDH